MGRLNHPWHTRCLSSIFNSQFNQSDIYIGSYKSFLLFIFTNTGAQLYLTVDCCISQYHDVIKQSNQYSVVYVLGPDKLLPRKMPLIRESVLKRGGGESFTSLFGWDTDTLLLFLPIFWRSMGSKWIKNWKKVSD